MQAHIHRERGTYTQTHRCLEIALQVIGSSQSLLELRDVGAQLLGVKSVRSYLSFRRKQRLRGSSSFLFLSFDFLLREPLFLHIPA